MERKYSVYRLTSPSGGIYIGLTRQTIYQRWQSHYKKARKEYNHPLYNAIRLYGKEGFYISLIKDALTEKQAQTLEIAEIAKLSKNVRYNISEGGEVLSSEISKAIWAKINATPESRAAYLKKLSDSKLANDFTDYRALQEKAQQWRKDNAKIAYKISSRASRVAKRLDKRPPKIYPELSLKEALLFKHKRGEFNRRMVTKVWAGRDSETVEAIGKKISQAHIEKHKNKTPKEKLAMVSKARSAIDRSIQGPAASKGIKAFWVELRKDPVKHREHIDRRVKTLKSKLGAKVKTYDIINAGPDNRFLCNDRIVSNSGRLVQVQNLPKTFLPDLGLAREVVKSGDLDLLQMLYGNVPDTMSQLIRTCIIPPGGKKLLVSDFSAIEARVIAWLSNEKWRIDVFNGHGKIYEASGAQMFKVPIQTITKGSKLRDKAKIAELALGYQGGVNAMLKMGSEKMGLKEDELQPIVDAWRSANPNIVQFWYAMGNAAIECVKTKETQRIRDITFKMLKGSLFMYLPSGRPLVYLRAQIEKNKFDRDSITYEGNDQITGKWLRINTYGGKLVENCTQAIARDILCWKMLALDACGYTICMHVHDEVVLEVPEDSEELDTVNRIMGEEISWAKGLPLRGDSFETFYYKKD